MAFLLLRKNAIPHTLAEMPVDSSMHTATVPSFAAGTGTTATNVVSTLSPHAETTTTLEPEVARPRTSPPTNEFLSREQQAGHQEIVQDSPGDDPINPDSEKGCGSQPTDVHLNDLLASIQQLPVDKALKEEERAAEKIKQKMRPLSKLNAARRNITQNLHHEDSQVPKQFDSPESILSSDHDALHVGSEAASETYSSQEQRTSVASIKSGSVEGSIDESALAGRSKGKQKANGSKKETMLIEIESPRLVDAQTTLNDRRYFQCPGDPEPEGDFVYDFLYQHQRGAFFLGTPRFSSKSLLPVDPDEWTDQAFETSPMDITDYVLPDPSWEWVHKSWFVDMTGDTDEDGWEYAMTFHGSPWHGNYEVFRSFARRRRWLRLRKRKGKMQGMPGPLPEKTYPSSVHSSTWTKLDISQSHLNDPSPFPPEDPATDGSLDEGGPDGLLRPNPALKPIDLYKVLKKARSDREKLAYTAQYVVRYPGHLEDLETRLDRYLNLLDYETSRREFLVLLAAYSGSRKDNVRQTADHLQFYSDRKKLEA